METDFTIISIFHPACEAVAVGLLLCEIPALMLVSSAQDFRQFAVVLT